MPIGSNANYVPANLKPVPGGSWTWGMPYADQDQIVLEPSSPKVDVRYSERRLVGRRPVQCHELAGVGASPDAGRISDP